MKDVAIKKLTGIICYGQVLYLEWVIYKIPL